MSRTFGSLQVSLVFGPAGNSVEPDHATCLRYLAKHNILDLNMARAYGDGEDLLGAGLAAVDRNLSERFTVSTKVHPSMHASGTLSHESVLSQARESLSALGVDSVDYFLIHQPDTGGVPLEESLRAADELHRAGVFRRFVRNHT
jgi:aryl-alcohol dehydrogenase-like predicted oxidoreductase